MIYELNKPYLCTVLLFWSSSVWNASNQLVAGINQVNQLKVEKSVNEVKVGVNWMILCLSSFVCRQIVENDVIFQQNAKIED